MMEWNIDRKWLWQSQSANETFATKQLAEFPSLCLLGAAGLGKSWEIKLLAENESSIGQNVIHFDLGRIAASGKDLREHLDRILNESVDDTSFFLDGLDEAMIPLKQATAVLESWIIDSDFENRRLRISCRSAVWPGIISDALHKKFSEPKIVELQPFTRDDIHQILAGEVDTPDQFLQSILEKGVFILAQQPLTLRILIQELTANEGLSDSRYELFENAIRRLCQESNEREERGTTHNIPLNELIDAAEQLAVFAITTGKNYIDLNADETSGLCVSELSRYYRSTNNKFDIQFLKILANTGLFVGIGSRMYGFCHRQFAEYLAGRRIAGLSVHQAKAILATEAGWSSGVAGPLRETSAVVAFYNPDIAEWISHSDPEIIGLSDIADDSIRRFATLRLLDLFRNHSLTDAHLARNQINTDGLRYAEASRDLKPILEERGEDQQDIHACAISLSESWKLSSLSESLADIFLDESLPFNTRKDAGYALTEIGNDSSKKRMLPIVQKPNDHATQRLLGLALKCNYPENISDIELLNVLDSPIEKLIGDSYQNFLYDLELSNFDASSNRIEGLNWAIQTLERDEDCRTHRIAVQIILGAIEEIHNPRILNLVASYALECARLYFNPFGGRYKYAKEESIRDVSKKFAKNDNLRYDLIKELTRLATDSFLLLDAYEMIPGLRQIHDYSWLLTQAIESSNDSNERLRSAQLAYRLPWDKDIAQIGEWLRLRTTDPIATVFKDPVLVEFSSEQEQKMRADYEREIKNQKEVEEVLIKPTPQERVKSALGQSKRNPKRFSQVAQNLTLHPTSTQYDFQRFIIKTPEWKNSDDEIKDEITNAAKKLLIECPEIANRSHRAPIRRILGDGGIPALLLIQELDPNWLVEQSDTWWKTWAWYILRELHFNLMGEDGLQKEQLFLLLYSRVPETVISLILRVLRRKNDHSLSVSLLSRLESHSNSALDDAILQEIQEKKITGENLYHSALFVLKRTPEKSVPICLEQINDNAHCKLSSPTVRIAIALFSECPARSWDRIKQLFTSRPSIGKLIVGRFAYGPHKNNEFLSKMGVKRIGELLNLLFTLFPPEKDPVHEGAHFMSDTDSAILFRNKLLNWLSSEEDHDAVLALQELQSAHGQQYPWLRRPLADSERLNRLTQWRPLPLTTIAAVVLNSQLRLIRSHEDVVDGILYALERYNYQLKTGEPAKLDELWNDPFEGKNDNKEIPSPKTEEHISDKIREAIRTVFSDFSVTAQREVQIHRRKTSKKDGGEPGSEVDVYVEVPATGSSSDQKIVVIIEVKRSCNPEAKTGLQQQLVDRYMNEEGVEHGVFVVAYFDAPGGLRTTHRPEWKSLDEAENELREQAEKVSQNSFNRLTVKSFMIDAQRK